MILIIMCNIQAADNMREILKEAKPRKEKWCKLELQLESALIPFCSKAEVIVKIAKTIRSWLSTWFFVQIKNEDTFSEKIEGRFNIEEGISMGDLYTSKTAILQKIAALGGLVGKYQNACIKKVSIERRKPAQIEMFEEEYAARITRASYEIKQAVTTFIEKSATHKERWESSHKIEHYNIEIERQLKNVVCWGKTLPSFVERILFAPVKEAVTRGTFKIEEGNSMGDLYTSKTAILQKIAALGEWVRKYQNACIKKVSIERRKPAQIEMFEKEYAAPIEKASYEIKQAVMTFTEKSATHKESGESSSEIERYNKEIERQLNNVVCWGKILPSSVDRILFASDGEKLLT